jgi:hypothetical protein
MSRYEVIPSRSWVNLKTGARASVYGSVPYVNDKEAKDWIVKENGYTIKDNKTGNIGAYACPAGSSKEHANSVAEKLNSRCKQ